MQRGPLSEDEAVRLFASRAADARGSPVIVIVLSDAPAMTSIGTTFETDWTAATSF